MTHGGCVISFTPSTAALNSGYAERERGKWLIVHEHVSEPVDLATGKGDFNGKFNSQTMN
jgi:hypothetical protein